MIERQHADGVHAAQRFDLEQFVVDRKGGDAEVVGGVSEPFLQLPPGAEVDGNLYLPVPALQRRDGAAPSNGT